MLPENSDLEERPWAFSAKTPEGAKLVLGPHPGCPNGRCRGIASRKLSTLHSLRDKASWHADPLGLVGTASQLPEILSKMLPRHKNACFLAK